MVMNSSIKCRIRVGIFCWLRKRWFRTKGSIQVRCAYHGSAIIDCHRKTIFLIPVSRSLRSDQDKSHEREAWIYAPRLQTPTSLLSLSFSLSLCLDVLRLVSAWDSVIADLIHSDGFIIQWQWREQRRVVERVRQRNRMRVLRGCVERLLSRLTIIMRHCSLISSCFWSLVFDAYLYIFVANRRQWNKFPWKGFCYHRRDAVIRRCSYFITRSSEPSTWFPEIEFNNKILYSGQS